MTFWELGKEPPNARQMLDAWCQTHVPNADYLETTGMVPRQ
jgi:hypothetical protein